MTTNTFAVTRLPFSMRAWYISSQRLFLFCSIYRKLGYSRPAIFRRPGGGVDDRDTSSRHGDERGYTYSSDRRCGAARYGTPLFLIRLSPLQVINNFRPPMPLGNRVLRECGSFWRSPLHNLLENKRDKSRNAFRSSLRFCESPLHNEWLHLLTAFNVPSN